ncbi:MAG: PadR family transcriptional regulator [Gaiellales bacterium]|nr:PadR family transcriptional regulator [Gaiellales bacterium]
MHRHDWHGLGREFVGRGRGFFERGGIKFVILDLLREHPRHGYDIIQEIETGSGGFYAPSPGVIYPTLQALEDQGFVRGTTEESGKKVYSVTDDGLAYLEEHAEEVREHRARMGSRFGHVNKDELHDTIRDMRNLSEDIRHAIHGLMSDPEKMKRVRQVIQEARRSIAEIVSQ